MKKAMIGVAVVVVAAVVGFATYDIVSNKSATPVQTSLNNNSTNQNDSGKTQGSITVSSTTQSSTDYNNTISSSIKNKKEQIVHNDASKDVNTKAINNEKKDSDNKNNSTESSKAKDSTTQSSTTVDNTNKMNSNSSNSSTKKTTTSDNTANIKNSVSDSNSNVIDGKPVLYNNNKEVSVYYGTWTVGDKIGGARVGIGQQGSSPTGKYIILTKSLYSFDGTTIEDPNYYIISTNAKSYFGSSGWSGDIGATSNGVISFIIAAPSNVKVTSSTIYKYERQSKVIINHGSLAILNGDGNVYSAKL